MSVRYSWVVPDMVGLWDDRDDDDAGEQRDKPRIHLDVRVPAWDSATEARSDSAELIAWASLHRAAQVAIFESALRSPSERIEWERLERELYAHLEYASTHPRRSHRRRTSMASAMSEYGGPVGDWLACALAARELLPSAYDHDLTGLALLGWADARNDAPRSLSSLLLHWFGDPNEALPQERVARQVRSTSHWQSSLAEQEFHDDLLFRAGQDTVEQTPWDTALPPLIEQVLAWVDMYAVQRAIQYMARGGIAELRLIDTLAPPPMRPSVAPHTFPLCFTTAPACDSGSEVSSCALTRNNASTWVARPGSTAVLQLRGIAYDTSPFVPQVPLQDEAHKNALCAMAMRWERPMDPFLHALVRHEVLYTQRLSQCPYTAPQVTWAREWHQLVDMHDDAGAQLAADSLLASRARAYFAQVQAAIHPNSPAAREAIPFHMDHVYVRVAPWTEARDICVLLLVTKARTPPDLAPFKSLSLSEAQAAIPSDEVPGCWQPVALLHHEAPYEVRNHEWDIPLHGIMVRFLALVYIGTERSEWEFVRATGWAGPRATCAEATV
ncbi:hypothetical protein MCAP1_001322 [Malassezia caprae]|uniref:Uncharacterized protein n=1 Tax=Malassezia caprae TaxID=1381934 RepID=A0AAF0IVS3_9BASI|nr:hypothetical protein MCAP1_001322 [Malassezia caprae]